MSDTTSCYALGLDIGGSSVKWAVLAISDNTVPQVVETGINQIDDTRLPLDVINELAQISRRVRADHGGFACIGVGIPGIFDAEVGSPSLLPNFPDVWHGFPLKTRVEETLRQHITLVNDAKAFSIAESVVGAAAGRDLVACVVLGTGVGGGIVQRGRILTGQGSAGELGHLTIDLDGPLCGCGNNGCVEAFAGAAAISTYAGQPSARATFEAARNGDEQSQAALDRAVRALGAGLANVFITLAPDAFVIGGGLAGARDQLIEPLAAEIRRRVKVAPGHQVHVLSAELGRCAGAIGAALMSAQRTGEL